MNKIKECCENSYNFWYFNCHTGLTKERIRFKIAGGIKEISFCPFCGKKLEVIKNEQN